MNTSIFLVVMALSGSGDMQFKYHRMPSMEVCQECVRSAQIKIPDAGDSTEFKSSTVVSSANSRNSRENKNSQTSNQTTRQKQQAIIAMYCTTSTARDRGDMAW